MVAFAVPTPTHHVLAENAQLIWKWFQERGGIVVWHSVNLSNPGRTWTGPMRDAEGNPPPKPSWEADEKPAETFTDPMDVFVDVPQEVKRFRVGIRMGSQGTMLKCTDGASRRIRREVAKRQNSWYEFDLLTQECVIYVPGESQRLPAFIQSHQKQEGV